jgi:nucleotide-binding universal stress UspA family protein
LRRFPLTIPYLRADCVDSFVGVRPVQKEDVTVAKRILAPLWKKLHLSSETTGESSLFHKILLPLDGSALAEEALPYAIAQAQRFAARLILLKVVPPLLEARSPHMESVVAAAVEKELRPVAEQARAAGVPVEVVSVEGGGGTGCAPKIVHYAAQNEIDLIVMSTRGHGGFNRWVLGSTADGVVRKAPVPVLLVRVGEPHEPEEW